MARPSSGDRSRVSSFPALAAESFCTSTAGRWSRGSLRSLLPQAPRLSGASALLSHPQLPFLRAPWRHGCRHGCRAAGSLLPELPFLGAPWRNGCRLTAVGQQALSSLGSRRARRLPPGRLEAVAPSCTPLPGGTLAGTTLAEGGVPAPPGGPGLSRRLHELLRRNTPLAYVLKECSNCNCA